jgi:hypothetical protein
MSCEIHRHRGNINFGTQRPWLALCPQAQKNFDCGKHLWRNLVYLTSGLKRTRGFQWDVSASDRRLLHRWTSTGIFEKDKTLCVLLPSGSPSALAFPRGAMKIKSQPFSIAVWMMASKGASLIANTPS